MKFHQLRVGASLMTAALLAAVGCESSSTTPSAAPPSRTEAKVSGKVTANGTPVSQGKVTVSPPGPPFVERVADIKKDGTYEVTTYIGKNSISVSGTGSPSEGGSYNKRDFDVTEGSNSIDLALPLVDK